jgi:ketosteroid isomerase-like protein
MRVARVILFYVAMGASAFGQEHRSDQAPRRVVTTTRLVAVFSELENQWLQAVQHKDEAALTHLLGEDFQEWMPQASGPLPREEWQQLAFAKRLSSFRFRQMAVRSVNEDAAVVSFVLSQSVQSGGKIAAEDYFVVDIWSQKSDHWVCTDRYALPLSKARERTAVEDLKPSGKR